MTSKTLATIIRYGFQYEPIIKKTIGEDQAWFNPEYSLTDDEKCNSGMFIYQMRNNKLIAYYYYPTTGKWRAKGKTKFYYSKSVQHLMDILIPRSSKIDNLLKA